MRDFFPANQKLKGVELSESEKLENYFIAINNLDAEQRAAKLQQLGPENLGRMLGEEALMGLVHQTVNLVGTSELAPAIRGLSDLARARVMYCLNKKDEALKSLFEMVTNEDEEISAPAYYQMGQIFFMEGDLIKAMEAFEMALALGHEKGKTYLGLARAALARKEVEKARAYLLAAKANGNKLSKSLLAVMFYEQGGEDEAIDLLARASIDDHDMQALRMLEDLLKKSGRISKLLEVYLEIVKGGDLTAARRMSELEDFKSVDDVLVYDFVIETAKEAIKQKKGEIFYAIGGGMFEAFDKGHRKDELREIFNGLIDLGNGEVAHGLGSHLYEENKIAEAIGYLEIALKLGNQKALLSMGVLMRAIGDFSLAEKYFLDAMRAGDKDMAGKSVQALLNLYVQFGMVEKIFGMDMVIGEVGKALSDETFPRIVADTMKNIVMIGKNKSSKEKNPITN